MDESLHDALDVIAFLLAVIAAAALADLTLGYGLGGLMLAALFLIPLSVVGVALAPDRDRLVGDDSGEGPGDGGDRSGDGGDPRSAGETGAAGGDAP